MMKKLEDFPFIATSDQTKNLADLEGKYIVLYFYPKDNTPGCTRESKDFRDLHEDFLKLNATVYGVSLDSLKSHEGFKEKLKLPFDLIADKDGALCGIFNAHRSNSIIEKIVGIDRCTFLIDPQGNLIHEWRKVKVTGHVKEVLEVLSSHAASST